MILNVIYAPARVTSSSSSAVSRSVPIAHLVVKRPPQQDWFRLDKKWNESCETSCGKSIYMIPVEFVVGATGLCSLCEKSIKPHLVGQFWAEGEVARGRASFLEFRHHKAWRKKKIPNQDDTFLFDF